MQTALLLSALAMGLATGPHCAVMCGPLCAGIRAGCAAGRSRGQAGGGAVTAEGAGAGEAAPVRVQWFDRPNALAGVTRGAAGLAGGTGTAAAAGMVGARAAGGAPSMFVWHLGRLAGYALAGAGVAASVSSLSWLAELAPVVRPLWVMLHAAVLAWGIVMLVRARPPMLGQVLSRWFERRLATGHRAAWWPFALGVSWAALPCGLLYSALMLAGLSDSASGGAAAMALFAAGSGVSLWAGPTLWAWWRRRAGDGDRLAERWGNRLTGALLVAIASATIWGDVTQRVLAWCR